MQLEIQQLNNIYSVHMHIYHLGFHCNSQCPDELLVEELTSNSWHIGIKIFIAILFIGLLITCIIMKAIFKLWLVLLERRQNAYLKSLKHDSFLEEHSEVD